MQTTLKDLRLSRFPQAIGACYTDIPRIAAAANECVQRLMIDPRQPETGWFGTRVPMVFNVTRANPYITAPRGIARFLSLDVCGKPIKLQNDLYEYLWTGVGILPRITCSGTSRSVCAQSMSTVGILRGYFPTLVDVPTANPQFIRAYPTDPLDIGKEILIQGWDANDVKIYGLDGLQQTEGFKLTLQFPFVDSVVTIGTKGIYGVQKAYTNGDVPLQAVDSVTGAVTTLARYEPGETRPWYPRYYIDSLPQWCCTGSTTLQVNVMAKRDYYPVAVDSDWLLIGNIPALISEAQSIYHDGIQEAAASVMSLKKHNDAILFLQGELDQYYGKENPATSVPLFGTADLQRQSIGSLI